MPTWKAVWFVRQHIWDFVRDGRACVFCGRWAVTDMRFPWDIWKFHCNSCGKSHFAHWGWKWIKNCVKTARAIGYTEL